MAKIIVSCRFQKNAKDMADLIRYMATREGVEKLPNGQKYNIASSKQHDLILSVVKHFPQSKKFLEYDDYYAMPTKENANEFLDAVAERYSSQSPTCAYLVAQISDRKVSIKATGVRFWSRTYISISNPRIKILHCEHNQNIMVGSPAVN